MACRMTAMVSMWSNSDLWSGCRLAALLFVISFSSAAVACSKPVSICPKRSHVSVRQIHVFDGKPEDLAYLAPDDPDTAPNTYTVGNILVQGRGVVVRCRYDDGVVRDVELEKCTKVCRYTERGTKPSVSLVCK